MAERSELDWIREQTEGLGGKVNEAHVLPDGSGFATASWPLPKGHWIYAEHHDEPPMPMRIGIGTERDFRAAQIRAAAQFAIRASTRNGTDPDFDPDAMVQNMVVGLLGYWTEDGFSQARSKP